MSEEDKPKVSTSEEDINDILERNWKKITEERERERIKKINKS